MYVWGVNENGELGVGKGNEISTPKRLDLNFKVSFVSCGYYHSALISSSLFCFDVFFLSLMAMKNFYFFLFNRKRGFVYVWLE